ncbi:SDR family NAD(P)-dependent oxidoreductase [Hymenobacter weizhouensis]|uniref:SDR family NAD(P)-dependent oxidoreductase n=1 Tax=Hymenobacter sp. YIM 151500-1 TaxID=2987689 RepID=UPI00222714F5|nr:SDR family oxidoreductase [Hymenobacter sp. YIM 151500-1]UYZ65008.1 SDR family oxidoreductase [Hymenobacter sp. YIM 151500-1]
MNVTLITGASGGIGEAFARRLAAEKHNLVLVARSAEKLRALCDELTRQHGIRAQYVALDLAAPEAAEQLFAETERRGLEVDWLINNAGIGSIGDFATLDLGSELAMLALNLTTLVALTHRYLHPMRERRRGTIVEVGSMAGFMSVPFMAAYAASKAFVRSFTEALAEENAPLGIRVMLLCPGATATGFFDAANVGSENMGLFGELQTPAQVVEAAMSGLRAGRRTTISGAKNALLARLGKIIPTSLIVRSLAGTYRPIYQKVTAPKL